MIGIPLEDNYEATLTQALAASGSALTIYVSRTPVATFPASTEVVMTINPKKGFTRQENVLIESYNSTTKTLTVKAAGRAQNRYAGDSATALAHAVGSKIIISDAYPVWDNLNDGLAISGGTMTGQLNFSGTTHAGIKLLTLTTVQRDALTGANGMMIYNSTTGEVNQFIGGSWNAVSAGSTQPDASTTVAGKVEQADNAEVKAGTTSGATGAPLFVNPSSTVVTSSGAADDGLIPKLNGSGQLASGFVDLSSATVSQTTVTLTAGEAVDGTTTPQLVYMSDGTGGRTSGRFYKADADDLTNIAVKPIGIVTVNAASAGTTYTVITSGVVSGFTGLTIGATYYCHTTAGAITATLPAATSAVIVPVGVAISATQLMLQIGMKSAYATYSASISSTGTTDTVITTGFQPTMWFVTATASNDHDASQIAYTSYTGNVVTSAIGGFGIVDSTSATYPAAAFKGEKGVLFGYDTAGLATNYNLTLSINTVSGTSITSRRVVGTNRATTTTTLNVYIFILGV